MKRFLLLLGVLVAGTGLLPAAEPPPVQLPAVQTKADIMPEYESWIKVGSPHYLIYTDATEKTALDVLQRLEKVHYAAHVYFRRRMPKLSPIVVVLPTRRVDVAKVADRDNLEWVTGASGLASRLVDVIVADDDWRSEGFADIPTNSIPDPIERLTEMVHQQEEKVRLALARETFGLTGVFMIHGRKLVDRMFPAGPFWYQRGAMQFFENVIITERNTVKLGTQSPLNVVLAENGLLPWPRFFALTADAPEYRGSVADLNQLDAQAGLFLHFMLTNKDPAWPPRLLDWKTRMQAGRPATDAEFKAVFGQDFKSWDRTMETYLRRGSFYIRTVTIPKEVTDFSPTRTELRSREIRELLSLLQIINQRGPESTSALDDLLTRGLKSEPLRDLLAEACLQYGRVDAVRAQLKASQAARSTNPRVYALLADYRFADEVPQIALRVRLTPAGAAEIRALCQKALEIEPFLPSALNRWAWAEALDEKMQEGAIATIEGIYRRLHGQASAAEPVAALAMAYWRAGDRASARQLAQTLTASPHTNVDAQRIASAIIAEAGPAETPAAKAAERR